MLSEALVHYRRALQLAQHDPDLEHTVEPIQQHVEPPAPRHPRRHQRRRRSRTSSTSIRCSRSSAPATPPRRAGVRAARAPPVPSALDAVELRPDDQDPFALLERQLRERDEQRLVEERQAREAEAEQRRRQLVMEELEDWLSAIAADRDPEQPPA